MFQLPDLPDLDERSMREAALRQDRLTKPRGSLGRLEGLVTRLAGIQGRSRPSVEHRAVIVAAGDHGVAAEGVSAFPAEVTAQMVRNFLDGGAAVSVLARQVGARLVIVNAGVKSAIPPGDENDTGDVVWIEAPVAPGTRNFTREPALIHSELETALELGSRVVRELDEPRPDVIALGEMGIANTTSAAALAAVFTGSSVETITGRGTGIDDAMLGRKQAVVRTALELHALDPAEPLEVLRRVGGLEIATLVGAMFEAASRRIAVVLDGFIVSAAALVAVAREPRLRDFLIAGHRSSEAGHRAVLEKLELEPVLDLDLRLGEASGAVLSLPILEAATRTLDEMATFEGASVSDELDGGPS